MSPGHKHGFVLIGLVGPMDVVNLSLSISLSLSLSLSVMFEPLYTERPSSEEEFTIG